MTPPSDSIEELTPREIAWLKAQKPDNLIEHEATSIQRKFTALADRAREAERLYNSEGFQTLRLELALGKGWKQRADAAEAREAALREALDYVLDTIASVARTALAANPPPDA